MGYLKEIVEKLPNTNVIFVGTGILLVNRDGKVLLALRTDNKQWSLPGGSLEIGESLEECIIRETKEETSIIVNKEDIKLNGAVALQEPVHKNGNLIYIVSITYTAHKYDDTDFKLDSSEFTRWGYFSKEEIDKLDNITSYSREALNIYFRD